MSHRRMRRCLACATQRGVSTNGYWQYSWRRASMRHALPGHALSTGIPTAKDACAMPGTLDKQKGGIEDATQAMTPAPLSSPVHFLKPCKISQSPARIKVRGGPLSACQEDMRYSPYDSRHALLRRLNVSSTAASIQGNRNHRARGSCPGTRLRSPAPCRC